MLISVNTSLSCSEPDGGTLGGRRVDLVAGNEDLAVHENGAHARNDTGLQAVGSGLIGRAERSVAEDNVGGIAGLDGVARDAIAGGSVAGAGRNGDFRFQAAVAAQERHDLPYAVRENAVAGRSIRAEDEAVERIALAHHVDERLPEFRRRAIDRTDLHHGVRQLVQEAAHAVDGDAAAGNVADHVRLDAENALGVHAGGAGEERCARVGHRANAVLASPLGHGAGGLRVNGIAEAELARVDDADIVQMLEILLSQTDDGDDRTPIHLRAAGTVARIDAMRKLRERLNAFGIGGAVRNMGLTGGNDAGDAGGGVGVQILHRALARRPLGDGNVNVAVDETGHERRALRVVNDGVLRGQSRADLLNDAVLNENGIGGFKEVTFMINGAGAYSRLKYESGVHRVQRVPETESGGRIHTSTCTVAIMPEAEEIDFHLDMNDCKFDVFRASGNGGQCVNTTDSAVRLTHIPTGIVISCQDEKSQLKNKDKALKVLRSRLYEMELAKQHDAEAEARRSQIGTGDRSEKIRTYNFPQGRVTDHRIKLTLHRLDAILGGDLDEILDSLIAADQAAKLSTLNEEQ